MQCPICLHPMQFVKNLGFYTKHTIHKTPIFRCEMCNSYHRYIDPNITLSDHFEASSYTNLENEKRFKMQREGFFRYISTIAEEESSIKTVLDVGCSYGHLLDVFADLHWETCGVEPVKYLRQIIKHSSFESIEAIPEETKFSVITSIDSLYYVPDPLSFLQRLKAHINDDGVMIIRVTNRVPLLNLLKSTNKSRFNERYFGDQLHSFSHRAMQNLFDKCGLDVKKIITTEKGKQLAGVKYFVYYRVLPIICKLTGIKITPGIIYVCQKKVA